MTANLNIAEAGAEPPTVLLSCAVTLDGYLNDGGSERLELSTAEDRDEVDALRAASDAILVGAGTIRADNPNLLVRSAVRRAARELSGRSATPLRIVVTRSGRLGADCRVLNDGAAETVVYTAQRAPGDEREGVTTVTMQRASLKWVLTDLAARGIRRILIEGGETLSTAVLRGGLADLVRIAIAPMAVGRTRSPRIAGLLRSREARRLDLRLERVAEVGGMAVVWWSRSSSGASPAFAPRSDYEWLAEAIALAGRCVPSSGAYSVGAVIVDSHRNRVSDGHSRELDDKVHAEEAAIRKAGCRDLRGACIYTSMEPCSLRLSGRKPCVTHIQEAGIARVVYALKEPPAFVRCEGEAELRRAGVETVHLPELAEFAAEPNRHIAGCDVRSAT